MEALRRTIRLIRVNWQVLVCFELLYKAMVAVGFTLLASLGFRLVMRVMGLTYLTREGIGIFLVHPLTLMLMMMMVLLAIGRPHEVAHGSLRLSIGENNTEEDVNQILRAVPEVVEYLRSFSPVWRDLMSGKSQFIL